MTSSLSRPISLHWVVKHWTLREIKEHLETGLYNIDELDYKGRTPLLSLVGRPRCKASLVKVLLEYNANVESVDPRGRTPLLVALKNDNCPVEVLNVLLIYGADPKHRCSLGYCAVATELLHKKRRKIIELLHYHRAIFDSYHLCIAIRHKASMGIIERLIEYRCDRHNDCKELSPALYCAMSSPIPRLREAILCKLIYAGADVGCTNYAGQQFTCFALQNGVSLRMVNVLMNYGYKPYSCRYHLTPLLCATAPYDRDLTRDTNLERLSRAVPRGEKILLKTNLVRFLLKCPQSGLWIDVDRSYLYNTWGMEPFFTALVYCDYETKAMELLLDHTSRRMSQPSKSAFKRFLRKYIMDFKPPLAVFILLLERGYIDGRLTPLLHRALRVEGCHPEMVRFLLGKRSNVNLKNQKGQTPLEMAIRCKQSADILRILLEAGSRIGRERSSHPHHLYLAFQEYGCRDLNMNTTDPQRVLETEECLKALFTFAFLEFPDFDMCNLYKKLSGNGIDYLVSRGRMSKFLAEFPKICMAEVQNMRRLNVGDVNDTLFDIVAEKERYIRSHELDRCLEILLNKSFPIYHDFISSKMVRKLLIEKFREVPVCTAIIRNNSEQKFFLNYYCLLGILESPKLSTKDILSFILAYYHFFPRR